MTDGSTDDHRRSPSDTDALADTLALAASVIVVAAVLQMAAAVAAAIAMNTPAFDNLFRQRLIQAAQGANAFTAVLLLIAVTFVALFDYFIKDGDTRLPRQWRLSVLWGAALLGVLVVLLNITDIVNVGTASFGTRGDFEFGKS